MQQIILFLNILNLGWPSEQVPAKQTLFPPLAHIPLPLVNSSHFLFPSPNSVYHECFSLQNNIVFVLS